MRLRRCIGVLAAICVLVHAAMIARHDVLLLSAIASLQGSTEQQAALDPAAICHGAGRTDTEVPTQAPNPAGYQHCAVCLGLAPGVAISAPATLVAPNVVYAPARYGSPTQAVRPLLHAVRPPTRGPPIFA
jgi:hypothetical protein